MRAPIVLLFMATVTLAGCQSPARLEDGLTNPQRWLTYSGDYTGRRHSPLTQITPANVANLQPEWTFTTGERALLEATPLVLDGMLYFSGMRNSVWAIDGRSGKPLWTYERQLPSGLRLCCNSSNRGLAIHANYLYMETLDAHLVALDRRTGTVHFDVEIDQNVRGYSGNAAPLIVGDKVIVGISGGEFASRGFLDAYDVETGARRWRFWTIPAEGEPGSETWPAGTTGRLGGPTWLTGTYDAELDLLYWGTGNPSPLFSGNARAGDNLYTNSLVALDPDSGTLRWHYQFTPHDTHDWDANQIPVLADINLNGRLRRAVLMANRNGFFYVLDRATGEFLLGKPFVRTSWATEIASNGRPVVLPDQEPTAAGKHICPDDMGGTNFMSPSFDPARSLFLVTARETCGTYFSQPPETLMMGTRMMGGRAQPSSSYRWGALRALDPSTGAMRWELKYGGPGWAGVLSTASGLVFSADDRGGFFAVETGTGRLLWQHEMGESMRASPLTYMIGNRQYVTMASHSALKSFALPR
jgi:alcohol dehydrogenase (cytochrome c)